LGLDAILVEMRARIGRRQILTRHEDDAGPVYTILGAGNGMMYFPT